MTLLWLLLAGLLEIAPHEHCGHPPAITPCPRGVFCGFTAGLPVGPDLRVTVEICCHCGEARKCRDRLGQQEIPGGHGPYFPTAKVPVAVGRECSSWEPAEIWDRRRDWSLGLSSGPKPAPPLWEPE